MKIKLALSLMIFALPTFAFQTQEISLVAKSASDYTMVRKYSNINNAGLQTKFRKRTTDYPTQIVRFENWLTNSTLTCEEVLQKVDEFFCDHIQHTQFFYNTINFCTYDPATNLATRIAVNSYFDPVTDEAIVYLKKYLAEYNGKDFLGAPFMIESAKAVIVSLNIDAGQESKNTDDFLRFRHDNASHYFKTNYDLRNELTADIYQRFYSNDPNLILPFIGKWFYSAGVFQTALQRANYVELQPELIFLMDKEPKVFETFLKLYYGHHCSKYKTQRCL